jgi:hypothetical protein
MAVNKSLTIVTLEERRAQPRIGSVGAYHFEVAAPASVRDANHAAA